METLDSGHVTRPDPTRRDHLGRRFGATFGLAAASAAVALAAPAVVAAHQLTGRFTSPIPLGAYLIGAALAVAASFAIVVLRGGAPPEPAALRQDRTVRVPAALRGGLAGVGLLAWLWIVVRSVVLGGPSEGDVASLFLWTYGWVGLALVSAFIGPAWTWLDPFSTLHRLGAWALGRVGLTGAAPANYPDRLGRWPAVIGFAVFIWLELAVPATRSGRALGIVLVAYTVVTVLAMAQFGRDAWRRNGEVFSVWFGLVGRLAPLALVRGGELATEAGPPRMLRVRSFAAGLLEPGADLAGLVLVSLAVGGILFDGLSQTQIFFDLFGIPTIPEQTLLLGGWLALLAGVAVVVGRFVGIRALVAGLVPISIGYLIAHYLTFIVFDGQRIVLALSDPFGQGWDLLGVGAFEPATAWLPGAVAWSVQLVAVVGGHVIGAVAGHRAAVLEATGPYVTLSTAGARSVQRRQVPLALLMVGLTALTLWSLGQAVVTEAPETTAAAAAPATATPATMGPTVAIALPGP
jgi:hypothetical protein